MNLILHRLLFLSVFLTLASCSHKTAKSETSATAQASPMPAEPVNSILDPIDCTEGHCSTTNSNDYLNTIVLPKIKNPDVVRKCFLENERATKLELRHGHLSFRFEAKVKSAGSLVKLSRIYLSGLTNIPIWTKPCLISEYEKLTFPPFPDPRLKSTSAFGTIEMNWKP